MLDYEMIMNNLINHYQKDLVSGKPLNKYNVTYHHKLHNTKGNRENFPLFINSHSNGIPVAPESIGKDNKYVVHEKTATAYEIAFSAVKQLFENEEVDIILFIKDICLIWDRLGK